MIDDWWLVIDGWWLVLDDWWLMNEECWLMIGDWCQMIDEWWSRSDDCICGPPPHGELAGGLENSRKDGGQIHYGKLSQEVSLSSKMLICGQPPMGSWLADWKILARTVDKSITESCPRRWFEVQYVDMWATPCGELAGGLEILTRTVDKSITESYPRMWVWGPKCWSVGHPTWGAGWRCSKRNEDMCVLCIAEFVLKTRFANHVRNSIIVIHRSLKDAILQIMQGFVIVVAHQRWSKEATFATDYKSCWDLGHFLHTRGNCKKRICK